MYLSDFGDEPSLGNLHFSTYLSAPPPKKKKRGYKMTKKPVEKRERLNSTYLVVGPSQFLAFPSLTEYIFPFFGICAERHMTNKF